MVQEQNDFEQLDPNLIRAEHLGSVVFFTVVLVLGLVGWIVFAILGWGVRDARTWGILLAGSLLLVALGWWSYKYPYLRWRTTRFRETERGLELHRGVFWQHRIFIPRERIQHTDITQGPISRKFRIAELVINTAGNHNYEIRIEGLNFERATKLRLDLLPRIRSREDLGPESINDTKEEPPKPLDPPQDFASERNAESEESKIVEGVIPNADPGTLARPHTNKQSLEPTGMTSLNAEEGKHEREE